MNDSRQKRALMNNLVYERQYRVNTYEADASGRLSIPGHDIRSAEVNYLSESVPGDEITVHVSELEHKTFAHSIIWKSDDRELCRLQLMWKT